MYFPKVTSRSLLLLFALHCISQATAFSGIATTEDSLGMSESDIPEGWTVFSPPGYERALRNPLKGFTGRSEWMTLDHQYVKWNQIENDASDGIDKIFQYTENTWRNLPENFEKVIPRVYLHWRKSH